MDPAVNCGMFYLGRAFIRILEKKCELCQLFMNTNVFVGDIDCGSLK